MPSRRLPNSSPAVLRVLTVATEAWNNTPNPADRALSAETWSKLDDTDPVSLHSRYKKEANDIDLAQAAQAR